MAAPLITTEVEACNLALARIGQAPISSIESPTTWVEELCALHYPTIRRARLRGPRVYNFAKKYAQLTVDSSVTPAFGSFTSAFGLPNDFLRLLTLGDHTVGDPKDSRLFDVVGRYIYTADEDEADTLNISYVFDETNVAHWDAIFVDLMRLELAKAVAYKFTLKASLVKDLNEELKDIRLEAGAVAGQEKPPIRIQRSKFRDNRRMGGDFRDVTRHSI